VAHQDSGATAPAAAAKVLSPCCRWCWESATLRARRQVFDRRVREQIGAVQAPRERVAETHRRLAKVLGDTQSTRKGIVERSRYANLSSGFTLLAPKRPAAADDNIRDTLSEANRKLEERAHADLRGLQTQLPRLQKEHETAVTAFARALLGLDERASATVARNCERAWLLIKADVQVALKPIEDSLDETDPATLLRDTTTVHTTDQATSGDEDPDSTDVNVLWEET
jgi:hypothetical protein